MMNYMHEKFQKIGLLIMLAAPFLLLIVSFARAQDAGFTPSEKALIEEVLEEIGVLSDDDYSVRNYKFIYEENSAAPKGLPPGLAKKGKIPPGIAKQIDEGKRIPYGAVVYRDPDLLFKRLGQPRPGTYRAIINDDYVLLDSGTDIILDVVHDVVTARN